MDVSTTRVLVKHFPKEFTEDNQREFLEYFGAKSIKCMSDKSCLKYCAFADFSSPEEAMRAVQALHQRCLMPGHRRLTVELVEEKETNPDAIIQPARTVLENEHPCQASTSSFPVQEKPDYADVMDVRPEDWVSELLALCPTWHLGEPMGSHLRYRYPRATPTILTNIVRALALSPRLYTQLLHLMNRMHFPPPFGESVHFPGSLLVVEESENFQKPESFNRHATGHMEVSSGEESELASSPESHHEHNVDAPPAKRRKRSQVPRVPKLGPVQVAPQLLQPSTSNSSAPSWKEVFEDQPQDEKRSTTIQLLVTGTSLTSAETRTIDEVEFGGFGKIQSQLQKHEDPSERSVAVQESREDEDISLNRPANMKSILSLEALAESRLDTEALSQLGPMRLYSRGEPTSRLYIKNLARSVVTEDLENVFGGFVQWHEPVEALSFRVQLYTEGRMKGQAFVSFANDTIAQRALEATHGFMLKEKPMIVSFARSAKAKVDERSFLVKETSEL